MFCHRCGVEVQPKQRFCGDCGVSLTGVTDPTEELVRPARPTTPPADLPANRPSITDQLPVTQAVTGVVPSVTRSRRHGPAKRVYDFASDEPDDITHPTVRPAAATAPAPPVRTTPVARPAPVTAEQVTTEQPRPVATGQRTTEMPVIDPNDLRGIRFRFGVVTGTSVVAALVALVGVFANTISIATDSSAPAFEVGDWLVGDLGSNLRVAGLIGIGALLVG
ncbi:MAG: zinc ribbon domain-containing protein, partial [Ilumatobacteraceae bacterium]